MKKWEIVWRRKWKGNTSVEELELMKERKSRAMLGKDNQSGMKQLGSESGVELVALLAKKSWGIKSIDGRVRGYDEWEAK